MAVQHSKRTHAHQFIDHIKPNERNALRVILLTKMGLAELRDALGTQKMRVIPIAEERTGHARKGTTIELFRDAMKSSVTNLLPLDRTVT